MKTVSFSIEKIYPAMLSVLDSGGEFKMITTGTSMYPMLRNKKDTIVLIKHGSSLKKYDVPLYRRADGTFVLHRIIGVNKKGYVMCGDHQFTKEYGITYDNIVGVLKGFIRDGKYIKCTDFPYRCYAVLWTASRPFRYIIYRVKNKLKRIFKGKSK